jgi:hypothetical protein
MDKIIKDEKVTVQRNKDDLFLNEYNWESMNEEKKINFKIRLNTNNTILFSGSTNDNKNNEKIIFDKIYSLSDLHCYERFKNNENINDIYIYLLTMIKDNDTEFELKEEKELKLIIKPYTKSENLFVFILPKRINDDNKITCEICNRIHSGINYLRYIRDVNNNHNCINDYDNINLNNCDLINDKNLILNILKDLDILKKQSVIKDEEIKQLKNQIKFQNYLFNKENQELREKINQISNISNNNTQKNFYDNNNNNNNSKITNFLLENNNNLNDNNNKINNGLIKYNKGKKIFLKTYKITNKNFNGNPNQLKYHSCIVKNLSAKGVNDIFEVFLSNKDNQQYLISKNGKTHNLDVYALKDNKIVTSLKGHNNSVTMVRYFLKYKDKMEYLISADMDKNVIVWDINNNYNILHTINTNYIDNNIYSCYLFFDNFDNNYIFTSCGLNRYKKNETSYTKMYSFKDGKFEKDIIDSNLYNTYYLLVWYDEKNKINYLIELCQDIIIITNFSINDLYAKLSLNDYHVLKYYSGFIYNQNNNKGNDYLCCSTSYGCIVIWDLITKQLIYYSKITKVELYNIIQWNNKYAIISGGNMKSIKIFDLEIFKEVNEIKTGHSSCVNCVKKILHPVYGEALLISGNDHKITLWII